MRLIKQVKRGLGVSQPAEIATPRTGVLHPADPPIVSEEPDGLRPSSKSPRKDEWNARRPWRTVVRWLSLLFSVGIGVAVLFNSLSSANDDLASIIAKAGVGIAATTVAGAIATASFKLVDEQRALDQERRKVFSEIVRAYNQVKSTRRGLKAWGSLTTRSEQALQAEEAKELRTIMAKLNDAQLQFEAIAREIEQSHLFKREGPIIENLRAVENYINHSVLDRWEDHGWEVWEGANPIICNSLGFQDFEKDFKKQIRRPMDELTEALHRELFG
jgi:hypothetical protein